MLAQRSLAKILLPLICSNFFDLCNHLNYQSLDNNFLSLSRWDSGSAELLNFRFLIFVGCRFLLILKQVLSLRFLTCCDYILTHNNVFIKVSACFIGYVCSKGSL